MVEAAPAASLVVSKAQFLFQLLVIALDPPAPPGFDPGVGQVDQAIEGHVWRDGSQPIFGRLGIARGPFDQQPLLAARRGAPLVTMRRPPPNPGKARGQRSRGSLAPGNRLPACRGQAERKRLYANRTVLGVAAPALRWAAAARPRRIGDEMQ